MGLIAKLFGRRNINNPAVPLTSSVLLDYLGLSESSDAGVTVNAETAVTMPAVWAAVNLLCGAVGTLPVDVFQKQSNSRRNIEGHRAAYLLGREANPDVSGQVLREALMYNMLMYGCGYALIDRDGNAMVRQLIPMSSACTRRERRNGVTRIITRGAGGVEVVLRPIDVMVIPGLTTDGLCTISPIRAGKDSIGTGLAAQQFGATFFGNGASPGGVLEHPGNISKEAAERLRVSWESLHKGAKRAHKTAILEEGMKYHQLGVEPDKAQFIETRKFQVVEVARIFGVPPHMIMDLERATFSNIEHQAIGFVQYALNRWVVRIENEATIKLLAEREKATGHYVKLNVNGLMRGDAKSRSEYLTAMVQAGLMSINEARMLEDLNPIPGGDEHLVPLNMGPLSGVGRDSEPQQDDMGTNSRVTVTDDGREVRRAWLCDVVRRLVGEESRLVTEAARKHLVKPKTPSVEKFTAWLDGYYTDKFLARAVVELSGPLGESAKQYARDHMDDSRRQINEIIETVSADDLAPAIIERMDEWRATRWQSPNLEMN